MARGREVDKGTVELVLQLKGRNESLTTAQIGKMLNMDATTAGRILSTGSWEGYCKWKEEKARKEREKNRKPAADDEEQPAEELPGQMMMDLDAEEQPEQKQVNVDQVKMMRFWAAQFDDVNEVLQAGMEKIAMKLDKLNDTMMQLIRCIRKE